jgi:hypothetical protein
VVFAVFLGVAKILRQVLDLFFKIVYDADIPTVEARSVRKRRASAAGHLGIMKR